MLISKDEFGGRKLSLVGADGPGLVIQIQEGVDIDKIHVGFVVSVQGANVSPILHLFFVFILKIIGEDFFVVSNHVGNNIFSEVMGSGHSGIFSQFVIELVCAKKINAHGNK